MSTISPDQLPIPTQPTGQPFAQPLPQPFAQPAAQPYNHAGAAFGHVVRPQDPQRTKRTRLITMVVGGLVVLGGTAAAVAAQSSGSETTASQPRTERAHDTESSTSVETRNSVDEIATASSAIDLDQAYAMVFGVQGSPDTLDCVAAEIDRSGGELAADVADWTDGAQLSFIAAQRIFTPFAACAPTADFLAEMVPAAVAVIGGSADEACVADILTGFGIDGRAEAHALAATDADEFQARMYSTFIGCAV